MPFLLFGLFVIAVSILSNYRNRHERRLKEVEKNFWDRESAANSVRRQDISGLSYITIPFELFSIDSISDDIIDEAILSLKNLDGKRILNLSGQTNTDLKMQYGPANLTLLTEYDQNYTDMLLAISSYVNRLIELDQIALAIPALEFSIATGADVSTHYTILATYYKSNGDMNKILELKEQASKINTLMKQPILEKLSAIEAES